MSMFVHIFNRQKKKEKKSINLQDEHTVHQISFSKEVEVSGRRKREAQRRFIDVQTGFQKGWDTKQIVNKN